MSNITLGQRWVPTLGQRSERPKTNDPNARRPTSAQRSVAIWEEASKLKKNKSVEWYKNCFNAIFYLAHALRCLQYSCSALHYKSSGTPDSGGKNIKKKKAPHINMITPNRITIKFKCKNQYDKAYKSIVPDTGITAVHTARRTYHQFTQSL
jgi:hypothetical protein